MRSHPGRIRRRSSALAMVGACTSHNGRNNYRLSPVVRSSRRRASVSRLPLMPAVRRINQPKNYKHTRRRWRILPGAVRPKWRYFSQCASHNLAAAAAGVSSYSERVSNVDDACWLGWRWGWKWLEVEAICWMFAGWGRRRLLRRRASCAPSPVDWRFVTIADAGREQCKLRGTSRRPDANTHRLIIIYTTGGAVGSWWARHVQVVSAPLLLTLRLLCMIFRQLTTTNSGNCLHRLQLYTDAAPAASLS